MNEMLEAPQLSIENEVKTAPIATLADYRRITSGEDFSLLITLAKRFTGKRLVFFNGSTQKDVCPGNRTREEESVGI